MEKYKVSNKDLILFITITFVLTILMGFAMGAAYTRASVDSFPLVQMYYPAIGAMVTLLLNKRLRKELPKNFFSIFLFFTITSILYLLFSIFILHKDPNDHLTFWLFIGSISLILGYNMDSETSIESFGLKFMINNKSALINTLLFVGIYMISLFIVPLFTGEVSSYIEPFKTLKTWFMLCLLPLSFLTNFPLFLGEEYGWRYFLQPALQERMGKVKGVIILGIIWGIWHLPINMFYYSPETPFHSIINQLIGCIAYSVFLGYVYMKTENIWAISMIHFLNNSLGNVLYGATGTNLVYTWDAVLLNLIIFSILYLPFLLAKEYRKVDMEDKELVE
ncbi:type II CAAX endopeptidase family protein [Tissierella sp.]|uniref:CPBP family intramembrane glutamic endopeptidase n=1 Tax=Tissierella sp. TaxID=41274 RepID=UPI00285C64A4|nr:type II CAAX endopeptidase family protein [Tissierella sp.]MDR7855706.1 type II CAAX endopeptidase family protein [Tissierella sp.]